MSNVTLSYLSIAYRLPQRVKMSRDRDSTVSQKLCADLLEAHVGALLLSTEQSSRGSSPARLALDDWLAELFSPTIFTSLDEVVARTIARVEAKDSNKVTPLKRKAEVTGTSRVS